MSHHFRLRKGSEVSVLTDKKVSVAQKVIHLVSVLSIFAASAIVGIGFYEASRYPYFKDTQEGYFKPVERPETGTIDKFGGYKKKTSVATGYWYIDTIEEKNTFIDPLGNAYAMVGINKVRRGNYDDLVYREQYKGRNSQWARETSLLLTSWGMNAIADRSEHTEFQKPFVQQMPYMVLGNFLSPEAPREETEWPDPWSASFVQAARDEAANIFQLYGDDPYFIGVKASNESRVDLRKWDGTQNGWADWWHVLIDPQYAHADAQAKWEQFMSGRYNNDISTLNLVYGTSLSSFDDLSTVGLDLFDKFEEITEEELADAEISYADMVYWTAEFFGEFHRVIAQELKAVLPNVLIGTDAFPNSIVEDPILQAIGSSTDFTILNYYIAADQVIPSQEYIEDFASASGNPVLIGEFSFAVAPCDKSDDGGDYPDVVDQPSRAASYFAYRNGALRIPSVIGVVWNELIDAPIHDSPEEFDCSYVNFGFEDRNVKVYDDFVAAGAEAWTDFNKVKWMPVTTPQKSDLLKPPGAKPQGTDITKDLGPIDLTPIDPKAGRKYKMDPIVKTGTDRMKWYKLDPLNPNAEPPFTMPGPDVIEMMFGKSLEAPQS